MFLAVVGLLDSLYLAYVKLFSGGVCVAGSGCEIVNGSVYSNFAGIPIAILGAGAYIAMLLVLWLEPQVEFFEFNGPVIIFGLSFFGVLYSAYLTYLEIYVIRAICPFCVISAIVLLLMLVLSGLRIQQSMKAA